MRIPAPPIGAAGDPNRRLDVPQALTRYRSAARRQPPPGWGTPPLTARLCKEPGAPLGPPQI
jgi:hypothetical protein